MASPWLAVGSGAAEGLETLVARQREDEWRRLQDQARLAQQTETHRSNVAEEGLRGQQIAATQESNRLSQAGLDANRADLKLGRLKDDTRAEIALRPIDTPDRPSLVNWQTVARDKMYGGTTDANYGPLVPGTGPAAQYANLGTGPQQVAARTQNRLEANAPWETIKNPDGPGNIRVPRSFLEEQWNKGIQTGAPEVDAQGIPIPGAAGPSRSTSTPPPTADAPFTPPQSLSVEGTRGARPVTQDAEGNPVTAPDKTGGPPTIPAAESASMIAKKAENASVDQQLARVEALYKDEWVGPAKGRMESVRSQLPDFGQAATALGASPQTAKTLTDYSQQSPEYAEFAAEVTSIGNIIGKARSGATITDQEAARLQAELPSLNDQPAVFKAKMRNARLILGDLERAMNAGEKGWTLDGYRAKAGGGGGGGTGTTTTTAPPGTTGGGGAPRTGTPRSRATKDANGNWVISTP